MPHRLTKYKSGSIGETLVIALPLMMSMLSNSFMILMDRIILAHYSVDAMNAVGTVANTMMTFTCAFVSTAAIAEVFVGQYNGQKQPKMMAIPVWQMLWFALFSSIIFIPCAFWSGYLLIPNSIYNDAFPFYFWMMLAGPVFTSVAALSAFFIGQGRTLIVTIAAIISNIINILLDLVLIFGVEGYLEPMSSEGAGIATAVSQIIFLLILASIFFSKNNREIHHTTNYKFNKKIFFDCIKIGIPSTFNTVIIISGWALIANYIAYTHTELLTIYTLGVTFFLFFIFYTDSLAKAVTAIIANAIGSNSLHIINKVIRSASLVHLSFLLLLFIVTWLFPMKIIEVYFGSLNLPQDIIHESILTLKSLVLLFLFEGFVGIFLGILTAGGDTKYLMITNTISVWICTVLPALIWLKYFPCKVSDLYIYLFPLHPIITLLMYYFRFKSNNWIKYKTEKPV